MRFPVLASIFLAAAAAETRPHVVFLIGETEYKSELTMPPLARELESRHGMRTTTLFSAGEDNLPGLEALKTADAVVLYLRFRLFSGEQMNRIRAFFDSGKPVVALRTTTHAFNNWKEFGETVLGAPWRYHYGHESSTVVGVAEGAAGSPILEGIPAEFTCRSWLYHVLPIAADARPLLVGRSVGPSRRAERVDNPVAWTRAHNGARVFYTSLGHPEDFQGEVLRRLVLNAVRWVLGK